MDELDKEAGFARDSEINRITLDPVLPAYGAPGMADQVFNLRSTVPNMMLGFSPDHGRVERSTLLSPHGDIL